MKLYPLWLTTLVVAGCMVTAGFSQAMAADKTEPIIVFDRWWSVDLAKSRCGMIDCSGAPDIAAEVHGFIDKLATQIAANPNCRGVIFFGWPDGASAARWEALKEPHWELMIDYILGQPVQPWKLDYWALGYGHFTPNKDPVPTHTKGEGSLVKVVADICAIVLAKGGTLAR